ncbi:hypothetical protein JCM10295v2_005586 [Rhodotorula toruloides]
MNWHKAPAATVKAKKLVKKEASVQDFCRNRGFENFEIQRLDLVVGNWLCDIRSSSGTVICVKSCDALELAFKNVEPSRENMSLVQLQLHLLKERQRAMQTRLDRHDEEKSEALTIEIAMKSSLIDR